MADANNSQKINLNFEEYSLWTLWLNVIMILKLLYDVAPDACPAWLPNLEIVYFKCPGHEKDQWIHDQSWLDIYGH